MWATQTGFTDLLCVVFSIYSVVIGQSHTAWLHVANKSIFILTFGLVTVSKWAHTEIMVGLLASFSEARGTRLLGQLLVPLSGREDVLNYLMWALLKKVPIMGV